MDSYFRPTRLEISLDALSRNLAAFRDALPRGTEIMAVVKADAYGHGAVEVAKTALSEGASRLAVACLDEALQLRRAGIQAPVLVMGHTTKEGMALAAEQNIAVTVYSAESLEAAAAATNVAGHPLTVHVKLDTGMGRLGFAAEDEAIRMIEQARSMPGISVEGLFTHFACADERDKTYSQAQFEKFSRIVKHFAQKGVQFPCLHVSNSAAAIDLPEFACNMIRLGISLYGFYPSDEVNRKRVALEPVMSLKTEVVMAKTLPAGCGISYGARYRTRENERIATLPIGYADGFSRRLTGKAYALVRGQKVPVVGTICMDQCMISVPADVQAGDEVVLIGSQGGETISADDIAEQLGTISYEVVCMMSRRLPRVYVRNGQVVNVINYIR